MYDIANKGYSKIPQVDDLERLADMVCSDGRAFEESRKLRGHDFNPISIRRCILHQLKLTSKLIRNNRIQLNKIIFYIRIPLIFAET